MIGPHPWLYFVLGGQPATPMRFMHYTGRKEAYDLVAEWLFRGGMPDVILLTVTIMPPPIAAQIQEWAKQDFTVKKAPLPRNFIHRFWQETNFAFAPEVSLLSRPELHP